MGTKVGKLLLCEQDWEHLNFPAHEAASLALPSSFPKHHSKAGLRKITEENASAALKHHNNVGKQEQNPLPNLLRPGTSHSC